MNLIYKKFDDLTNRQVYEILKSRSEIFLLEQNIVCQDMDDIDYEALHCFFEKEGKVIAYLRAYVYCEETNTVKIGRVITLSHGNGTGRKLFEQSLEAIKSVFSPDKLIISAQKQAVGFYEKFGFEVVSDEYMEENVAHFEMQRYV